MSQHNLSGSIEFVAAGASSGITGINFQKALEPSNEQGNEQDTEPGNEQDAEPGNEQDAELWRRRQWWWS